MFNKRRIFNGPFFGKKKRGRIILNTSNVTIGEALSFDVEEFDEGSILIVHCFAPNIKNPIFERSYFISKNGNIANGDRTILIGKNFPLGEYKITVTGTAIKQKREISRIFKIK